MEDIGGSNSQGNVEAEHPKLSQRIQMRKRPESMEKNKTKLLFELPPAKLEFVISRAVVKQTPLGIATLCRLLTQWLMVRVPTLSIGTA